MTNQSGVEVVFDADTIFQRVDELATEISGRLPEDVLIVVVLKGSFVFAADLLRALDRSGMQPRVDFISLSSYGTETESSRKVQLTRDLSEEVRGQTVLVVDDILDTGRTLAFAVDLIAAKGASAVHSCVLLDKRERREVRVDADFVGFDVGNVFVVGYGIDLAHRYRSLPYIGAVRSL